MVGTSGSAAIRAAEAVASTRTCPARAASAPVAQVIIWLASRPAIMSERAGAPPR